MAETNATIINRAILIIMQLNFEITIGFKLK